MRDRRPGSCEGGRNGEDSSACANARVSACTGVLEDAHLHKARLGCVRGDVEELGRVESLVEGGH
jgi:hypothetical protein